MSPTLFGWSRLLDIDAIVAARRRAALHHLSLPALMTGEKNISGVLSA
jgi:hypothetical protein